MSNGKILITSALPYANGPLHFGHIAGAYLPADCYARFERLQKNDVLFLCGSDEYGIAISLSAEIAGRTPEEHVNIYHEVIRQLFGQLNISFDHYSRTTWKGHDPVVQKYFTDLVANGFIEARVTDQLYSAKDNKFLADRYVTGTCPACGFKEARGDECTSCGASFDAIDLKDPKSKLTGAPLERRATKHWFLLLEKFKERLQEWIKTKDWKPNVINFIKGYIDDLHARAITRDSTWGIPIPLPDTEGKVLYVWFDAPIGYISATKEWAEKNNQPESWKSYWNDPKTKLVQFIGKDNIPFHAVIFPSMTMGQNEPFKLVDDLPANEFYNLEGRQFSKSEGWYIDLDHFFKSYTADQIRYTIAANAPETADSEFTWKDFQLRCNTELLGKLGNLVNRVLVFAKTHSGSKVPALDNLQPIDSEFLDQIRKIAKEAKEAYQGYKLRKSSQALMELAQAGNVYFDAKKPWKDAKDPALKNALETTIACSLECIKTLALVAFPIIPAAALKIWKQLGFVATHESIESLGWDKILLSQIPEGQLLGEPEILFRKIEDAEIEAEMARLKGAAAKPQEVTPQKPLISYEEFDKLDLRVATVLKAEAVPKSKKLFRLEVAIGSEQRQIVSGIAEHFSPEELVGKSVIIVANLKPAKLMGIESQGMILASSDGEGLKLAGVEKGISGSIVK
jgi:methionyl-tRNA synthetase